MSLRTLGLLSLAMLTATQVHAEPQSKLAVLPFTANRIPAQTAAILDDLLVNALSRTQRFDVISTGDVNALLGLEKMRDMMNCSSTSCMAEIGGALGVDYLLAGSVSVLGDQLIVSLSLIDTKKQRVVNRQEARVSNEERRYADAIDSAVAALTGTQASGPASAAGIAAQQAEVLFVSDTDTPDGVFVRNGDGEEHHCPLSVNRDQPCTLALLPGTYTVLTKSGMARRRVRFFPGHTDYKLHVGSWTTGLFVGGGLLVTGTAALITGGVTLRDCSQPTCSNAGSIVALSAGGGAAYAGLMMMLISGVLNFDQSEISGPGSKARLSWVPALQFHLGPRQHLAQAAWAF